MVEVKFSGFGGQGIIRMGSITGKAASLHDGKQATLTQSFGPEARGGACSAQLVVSAERILYPYVTVPDILVAMSQEAYVKFEPELKDGGWLLIDEDLVQPHPPHGAVRQLAVPATRIAETMGNRMFANMVMLGFLAAVTGIVPLEALEKALPGSVPDRSIPKNIEAMRKGWGIGKQQSADGS
ncbi:MAG TPA: pyruvate ferredoxin oxidoreductase [candidate division WOR-3 bacterium]|uniref:Pyruvate ferredoxin oxidoreductase n=1 Tax=candidate division WOR-3 bacterium TaxID=2052148 RepID=A0A7V0T428_UNCW3|nr:pyruvate ferredoxin oxidoreductase [candidate division WOR-3 bacterium]